MRRLLAVVAVGAVLVGCAGTTPGQRPADTPDAAETLQVRCDGETTETLSSAVHARSDGVHILVLNTSDAELLIQWESGGDGADPGETMLRLPIAPGRARFRCLRSTDDVDPGVPGGWASFDVLPADGWVSPDLECPGGMSHGVSDYAVGATGVQDPLVDARRRFLLDGEVLEAGYATDESRTFINVVEGAPKESLVYLSDGAGGWLQSESYRCS
jgi:hypothetical protein